MGVARKQGISLALGVGFGTFLWVLLAVLGFTAVISKYAVIMITLKVLGGIYLLWLGYKALRSAASGVHTGAPMWVGGSIVLGAAMLLVGGHIMYALAFSTQPMVVLYTRARRYIEAALGAFNCAMGIKLLTDRS